MSYQPEDAMFHQFVTQWYLGGGSSFSTGGPGKGILTRFYRLLSSVYQLNTIQCSASMYHDGSIFGTFLSVHPRNASTAFRAVLVPSSLIPFRRKKKRTLLPG